MPKITGVHWDGRATVVHDNGQVSIIQIVPADTTATIQSKGNTATKYNKVDFLKWLEYSW